MRIARLLSLLGAIALSAGLFVYPRLLGSEISGAERGALMLMLLGVCGGFVHGVGYVPDRPWWRFLFGPPFAWPAMLLGTIGILVLG